MWARIVRYVEAYRPCSSGEVERLLRIHCKRGNRTVLKDTGRIIIHGFAKLAIANHNVVWRRDSHNAAASLDLGRGPCVVLALTKINIIAGSAGNSPHIGI